MEIHNNKTEAMEMDDEMKNTDQVFLVEFSKRDLSSMASEVCKVVENFKAGRFHNGQAAMEKIEEIFKGFDVA